jgi:hypothetical protein
MGLTMLRQIFHLRIVLADVEPPVWRRVAVPGGYTLDRLHRVIQHAMGWQDCHLHCFEVDGVQYGIPDPDGEPELVDEMDARLDTVVAKGGTLAYVYDFGDWWHHDVLVEDVVTVDAADRYPAVTDGARQCPPEDVGGPPGHAEFLAAIADPAHPRHTEMRDWIGRDFDPLEFHPERASVLARRLS